MSSPTEPVRLAAAVLCSSNGYSGVCREHMKRLLPEYDLGACQVGVNKATTIIELLGSPVAS